MAIKYLEKYGQRIIDAGYDICFIRPGEKRPFGSDWEAKKHGPKRLASAIEAGRGGYGIGIKTKHTPMVDIDCYDEDLVEHMIAFTEKTVGQRGLLRVGLAPKTGIVFRADEPFPKTQSKVFIDDEGRAVKLEVLGDGQQFVAFHVHPETGKPYKWLDGSPLDTPHDELVDLDRDDSLLIVAEFEKRCRKLGWQEKSTVKRLEGPSGRNIHYDDPFISDKEKVDLPLEEIAKKLVHVPNPEDYDTWFHVGMALYHQFDGSQEGLDLWHQWSADAHNYEMDALDEKWPTFEIEGKKREPLTARSILKLAQAEEARLAGEELTGLKKAIAAAENEKDIQDVVNKVRRLAFTPLTRDSLATELRKKIKEMTGIMPSSTMIRKQIAFENPNHKAMPDWLKDWVFLQLDEKFYNRKTRSSISSFSFDMTFNKFLLTKSEILEGKATPETPASKVAVNRYNIPTVYSTMYAPRQPEFFSANGNQFVNGYSDANVPDTPDKLTKHEREVCDRVEKHLKHLCANKRDRDLLLSWLAYIVQTGGKINWSPVLQGVENDGKSFFGRMMTVVLGGDNTNQINGDQMAEKFTGWAEGSQFTIIEEVRLRGLDRFAIINKLKTYVANDMVTVRRMQTDSYKVFNTVNYFLTTNHKDGVPIDNNSTRYFPVFSRFQTAEALNRFNKANPDYYRELHEVLEHPGALRRWLMDYDLHEEFDPVERARSSSSKAEMVMLNQSEEEEAIDEILTKEEYGLSRELIDSTALANRLADIGVSVPEGRGWKRLLSDLGFTPLGQVKVNGKNRKFWSQTPEQFRYRSGNINTQAIRDALDPI